MDASSSDRPPSARIAAALAVVLRDSARASVDAADEEAEASLHVARDEARAKLEAAAEDARRVPLVSEDAEKIGLDRERRENMERAFDKGAAEMARRRARARRPSDAPPETLGGAAVGAAREGLLAVADAALVTLAG